MKKIVGEEEIRGLEEEIDSAVDRLFTEKKSGVTESISIETPTPEPSYEPVKAVGRESFLQSFPEPPSLMKSFEKMETQLLSLEWEITKENLEKTKEEVLALRDIFKERMDITSVLNLMGRVLIHMTRNAENIPPPQIKFLLDSKETLKLLMKKETEGEINLYKQLAFAGIEARYLCLEGLDVTKAKKPSFNVNEEREKAEIPKTWKDPMEGILKKMNLFSEKMDQIFDRIDQNLLRIGQIAQTLPGDLEEKTSPSIEITIFVIDEKLIGVESHKIFKLFKVPNTYRNKYSGQHKIRIKDFEIKLVDLKKIFILGNRERKGEIQLLTIKEGEEYKGLIVDQVLNKLSAKVEMSEEYGEYFIGMIHWTYRGEPVEIPILDLKKI
jgi:hypothetical protein